MLSQQQQEYLNYFKDVMKKKKPFIKTKIKMNITIEDNITPALKRLRFKLAVMNLKSRINNIIKKRNK